LTIEGGGVVNSAGADLALVRGSLTHVRVTGNGSQWTLGNNLTVGDGGHGTLTIESGSQVSMTAGQSIIPNSLGSLGEVTVSGSNSQWILADNLWVGLGGQGTLTIQNGGVVNSGGGSIGTNVGGVGIVTVTGNGSQWITSGILYIGDYGQVTFTISSGGVVTSNGAAIGFQSGSSGSVTVTGIGSQWNDTGLITIGLSGGLQQGGQGSLTLNLGGTGSSAALLIGGAVTVTDPGSKWTTTHGDLVVGEVDAQGTLTIANGAIVNNVGNSFIGLSGGTATVMGSGSQWNSAYLAVGYSLGFPQGQGTLTIESGGVVTTTGQTLIADFGGSGSVTVDGQGSQLTSAFVDVGNGGGGKGQGTLTIQNGGVVNSGGGSIGTNAGGVGIVTVTGVGSQWNNTGSLMVGLGGQGTLTIEDGGVVHNGSGVFQGSAALNNRGFLDVEHGSLLSVMGNAENVGSFHTDYYGHGGGNTLSINGMLTNSGTFELAGPGDSASIGNGMSNSGQVSAENGSTLQINAMSPTPGSLPLTITASAAAIR